MTTLAQNLSVVQQVPLAFEGAERYIDFCTRRYWDDYSLAAPAAGLLGGAKRGRLAPGFVVPRMSDFSAGTCGERGAVDGLALLLFPNLWYCRPPLLAVTALLSELAGAREKVAVEGARRERG